MKLRILILKLVRRFIWAKRGEQWSWDRYYYALIKIVDAKIKKLAEDSVQELINIYEFLSHGGFPENPAELKNYFLERIQDIFSNACW